MQVIGIEVEHLRTLIREETRVAIQQQLTPKEPEVIVQEWITKPVLKTVLRDKGYRAKSSLTIREIVKNHNVRTEKKGRDIWYNVQDVHKIPSKLSNRF